MPPHATNTRLFFLISNIDGSNLVSGYWDNSNSTFTYSGQLKSLMVSGSTVPNYIPMAVSTDSDPPSAVYLAIKGYGLWKSGNGLSWSQTSAPSNAGWQAITCSTSGSLVVAVAISPAPGLYISKNGGSTWAQQFSDDIAWQSVSCSADGATIWATVVLPDNSSIFYNSHDAGTTWSLSSTTDARAGILSVASGVASQPFFLQAGATSQIVYQLLGYTGEWPYDFNMIGPTGIAGDTGYTGYTGYTGDTGPT
ncbi:hypothetical protein EBZ80_26850, partial [bacterium]|nr:hypothetical protein [bacterium]